MYGPQDLWYHVDCFIAKRDELEFTTDMDPTKSVSYLSLIRLCGHHKSVLFRPTANKVVLYFSASETKCGNNSDVSAGLISVLFN